MCVVVFVLIFLICNEPNGISGQDTEGVPCENPNEEYGLCININNCPYLLNLLLRNSKNPRVQTFLRASTCGFIKDVPLVCCPQSKSEPESSTTTTTEKPASRTPRTNYNNNDNNVFTLPRKPNCGHSNYTNPRIVNGIPAKLGEFPWIVALGYKNSKNAEVPKWLCGGSLITDRHILTAAHCVYNRQDLYLARLGDLDLYSDDDGADPETIPLIKAKVHEEYSPVNFTNDIAILTLERSPRKTTAWPVCLPIEPDLVNNDFGNASPTVAGWGSIYFNGPTSHTLLEVILPVLANDKCSSAYGTRSIIDERIICAGYVRGGKDACQGDSGGPLMHRKGDKNAVVWFYQIGIVSYGLRCAEAGYPGVYTRVTTFLDWIQKNVN